MANGFEFLYGEWQLMAVRTDARHPFNDANGICFEVMRPGENKVVMVFEDVNDGYRSAAAAPFVSNCDMYDICDSADYLRIPVVVSLLTDKHSQCEGIEMRDTRNGEIILRVGTENSTDWYPHFVSEWMPHNVKVENDKTR